MRDRDRQYPPGEPKHEDGASGYDDDDDSDDDRSGAELLDVDRDPSVSHRR